MSMNSQASHSTSSSISGQSSTDVKSSFLKYEKVNNAIVSEFISSIPTSFVDIVNHMSHMYTYNNYRANDFMLNNRIKLQKFIRKFHLDADTMTDNVNNRIAFLNAPKTKLFVYKH